MELIIKVTMTEKHITIEWESDGVARMTAFRREDMDDAKMTVASLMGK